jgi:ABC-2 type transport system ATP-binding protein
MSKEQDKQEIVIHVNELCKYIKDGKHNEVKAVDGISLDIKNGEVFGFLGPNGAGKTTTFRLLAGLLKPTSGNITILGLDPWVNHAKVHEQIGFLTENHGNYEELTVLQNLRFFGEIFKISDIDEKINRLIETLSLEEYSDKKVGKLSRGFKLRVSLARVLLPDPLLLFLDEPTTGLDPISATNVRDIIHHLKSQQRTILICSHNLDEIQHLCDRVAIIDDGKIIKIGTPVELDQELWSSREIICELSPPIPENIDSKLREIDGVNNVLIKGPMISIFTKDTESVTPKVAILLVSEGCTVQELRKSRHSLEETYRKIVESKEMDAEIAMDGEIIDTVEVEA